MFSKQSRWIGCGKDATAPIVIKQFSAEAFDKAVIDICGLGYYELFVNGRRVSEDYFKPVVSDYSHRDFSDFLYPLPDQTSHSVYYNTYPITALLHPGINTLAVLLGNGFYRQTARVIEGNTKFGDELLLRFDLKLTGKDGVRHICTDGTESQFPSFIREDNLFFGETHDYADFSPSVLLGSASLPPRPVHTVPGPDAKLRKQHCKNDAVRERILPRVVRKSADSVIYDVGKNITGFVVLKPKAPLVRIRHAEELENGVLSFDSAGGNEQISESVYRNAQGLTVHPWFSWSGFRYFEVFGDAEVVEALFICSDVRVSAAFACGNETVNYLFNTYLNTQLGNMHGGVPSDCPHRERLGYTGDGQITAESAMLLTQSRRFYEKWCRDIADCQDIATGHIQHTAPFFGGGGGPGGWGCAIVAVPYAHYKMYGDPSILRTFFPHMLRYLESMGGFTEKGLIVRERDKGWCLGDWCTPEPLRLPEPFVNTFYYIRSMQTVQEIAALLGKSADFSAEIEESLSAMDAAYFSRETGDYCGGIQGANAFALTLGLGTEKTRENLLAKYRANPVFDTGIFGTEVLSAYLRSIGEIQLLYDLLSGEDFPSFGYMRARGATTLWENWGGGGSHSHPMFGGCVKELFYAFLGIRADPGFENIRINPRYIEGIGHIRASLRLPKGTLTLDCRHTDGVVHTKIHTTGSLNVRMVQES